LFIIYLTDENSSKIIKTPSLDLPTSVNKEEEAKKFAKKLYRITLAELIDDVIITEKIELHTGRRARVYKVELLLFPPKKFSEKFELTSKELSNAIENRFLSALSREISKALKSQKQTDVTKFFFFHEKFFFFRLE
jgi:hypothetical protein